MVFPNFFLIGAPKCGSTTLWELLRQHPEVFLAEVKEPNHFNTDMKLLFGEMPFQDPARYRSLFEGADATCVGEASVWYLASPAAAQALPADAKLIVILRPPADAVRSMYTFSMRLGGERALSLAEALELEPMRARGEELPAGVQVAGSLQYRNTVRYADQLSRYYERFERSQIKVVLLEDLAARPVSVAKEVFEFLGIDPRFDVVETTANATGGIRDSPLAHYFRRHRKVRRAVSTLTPPRVRHAVERGVARIFGSKVPSPRVEASTLEALREEFAPEVERLSELIERDLSHWNTPRSGT